MYWEPKRGPKDCWWTHMFSQVSSVCLMLSTEPTLMNCLKFIALSLFFSLCNQVQVSNRWGHTLPAHFNLWPFSLIKVGDTAATVLYRVISTCVFASIRCTRRSIDWLLCLRGIVWGVSIIKRLPVQSPATDTTSQAGQSSYLDTLNYDVIWNAFQWIGSTFASTRTFSKVKQTF